MAIRCYRLLALYVNSYTVVAAVAAIVNVGASRSKYVEMKISSVPSDVSVYAVLMKCPMVRVIDPLKRMCIAPPPRNTELYVSCGLIVWPELSDTALFDTLPVVVKSDQDSLFVRLQILPLMISGI